MAIELELTKYLEEEEEDADALINQFPIPTDYDGIGLKGTKFVLFPVFPYLIEESFVNLHLKDEATE